MINEITSKKYFYDIIIDINSIKNNNKGWKIEWSEKGEENYLKYKNEKLIKIGVLGNLNKGKTFILSQLSKIGLPYGISTKGLSIKYPELKFNDNRRIILLDSVGFNSAILNEDNENVSEFENEKGKDEEKKSKEIFKNKFKDKFLKELFIKNYIINICDIVIIVVGNLTYSEQHLINRIKTKIQKYKISNPLFIIHNLISYTSIKEVKEYINSCILKNSMFDLEQNCNIPTKIKNQKEIFFYEKNSNSKIFHLIYTNEYSEVGIIIIILI